jgi:hypothetical protein
LLLAHIKGTEQLQRYHDAKVNSDGSAFLEEDSADVNVFKRDEARISNQQYDGAIMTWNSCTAKVNLKITAEKTRITLKHEADLFKN